MERGSYLSHFIIESTLHLSRYPTDKIVSGRPRYLLYLTPVWVVTILPMKAIEDSNYLAFITALLALLGLFVVSVLLFNIMLKKYKSSNIIGIVNE